MGPLIQQKLFSYIDEHIGIYQDKWQQIRILLQNTSEPILQRNLPLLLTSLFQGSGVRAQRLDGPQRAIYGAYEGASPQTLLFFLPVYRSHQLEPLLCSLAALEAYQAIAGQVPITVKWLLDFGEGRQLSELVIANRTLLQANGCLWYSEEQVGEIGPQFALGTKGEICVELKVRTAHISPPTAHAGVLPNALWRLLWAVNSLKSAHEEILIEGFYDTVRPVEDDLAEVLYELSDTAQLFAQHWGLEHPLLGLHGLQFHYAHLLTPTCTISSITDDTQMNTDYIADRPTTIPTQASARLDFHLVPEQEPHDIFNKLLRHLQTQGFSDIEVRLLHTNQSVSTEFTHPFVQAVSQGSSSVYRHPPYILPCSAGSYPLAPLRLTLAMPVVLDLMAMPVYRAGTDDKPQHMAQQIKQLTMIMDNFILL